MILSAIVSREKEKKMCKWLIYPYERKQEWIYKYKNMWRFFKELKNANVDDKEITLAEFENELSEVEGVWIVDSLQDVEFEQFILPKIEIAVKRGKQIFCTRKLTLEQKNILLKRVPENQWKTQNILNSFKNTPERTIYDIDIPAVYFVGMTEAVNRIEDLLEMKIYFENCGYQVALFSDAKEVQIFDGCYWLSSLYELGLSQAERVIHANWDIKSIEIKDSPDLILLGITKGVSTLGRTYVEDFGINAYSMSRVIHPDCIVLNVLFGDYTQTELYNLGNEIKGVMNEEVDFYNVKNRMIDIATSELFEKIQTIEIDNNMLKDKLQCFDRQKLFSISLDSEVVRLGNAIIDKLAEYADVLNV